MSVVARIRDALSGETDREQPTPGTPTEPGERREQRKTRLYHCDPCGTTYVSEELDSCSRCDAPVERVPTEQDLGLV